MNRERSKPDREEVVQDMMDYLMDKYGLSREEMMEALEEEGEKWVIPVSAFDNEELSPLETIVKYLREEESLKYSEIATLTGRDERAIGTTYRNAEEKRSGRLKAPKTEHNFPVEKLKDKTLSVFEHIVTHLREEYGLKFSEIASLMNRDERTIWTVNKRAEEKLE